MSRVTTFAQGDVGKVFKVNTKDAGTGENGIWLRTHLKEQVVCLEISDLGWSALFRAGDGTTGWAFMRDVKRMPVGTGMQAEMELTA